jgi:choline-sulfatase
MTGKSNHPHILLLIDDEHRPDVMTAEGNPHIRMPTLDRIIGQGTYFRSAYTPAPVCVPARQSFLTGLYARRSGCTGFDTPLPSDVLTIPEHFANYGYNPTCAGKMHFVGPDQMHGWRERIGRNIEYSARRTGEAHLSAARPHVQGTGKWPTIKEITNARAGRGHHMAQDLYTVDGALLYLDEYFVGEPYDRPGEGPLMLAVSLNSPHYPYQCPEELFSYYLRRVEPYVENLPEQFDCDDFFKVRVGTDVTWREAHRATAAYYGMIELVDRQYGRVVSKLEELNVLDDFVIVFLSDHGEMLGQKGLWEKQQFFEASARVPFSITAPGRFAGGPRTVTHNVSLVDLFPTLCDIAGLPIPDGLDGRSLVPLLEGDAGGWPNEVYCELYHELNGPSEMVKADDLKYFRFRGKGWPEQLFDLAADPGETRNLVDDPAYAADLQRLRARLDAFEWGPRSTPPWQR